MAVQAFKENDAKEAAVLAAANAMFTPVVAARDSFFNGCYIAKPLGDVLKASEGTPLSKAISAQVFRDAFPGLFESFTYAGTYRAYIFALRKIFGDDVEITFTVPAPGRLQIDVVATNVQAFDFLTAEIVHNAYQHNTVVDNAGDTLQFLSFQGFETQDELQQLFAEMSPQGIFVECTLQLGE